MNNDIEKYYIPKNELIHEQYYNGSCRNASIARWDANKELFYHHRTKFGSTFIESIKHPVDEDKWDVFYPHTLELNPVKEIDMDALDENNY